MEIKTIASIRYLQYKNTMNGFSLDMFNVLKSEKIINEIFDENTLRSLGNLVRDEMLKYFIIEFSGASEEISSLPTFERLFTRINGYINLVIDCLWFIKDNSVSTYNFMLIDVVNKESGINDLNMVNSNSRGEMNDTEFSITNILDVRQYIHAVKKFRSLPEEEILNLPITDIKEPIKDANIDIIFSNKSSNRISIALYNIHLARTTKSLAKKITNLLQALESLFTVDKNDKSATFKNRVKQYYSKCVQNGEDISILEEAYNIRSKMAHSETLENQYQDNDFLIEHSVKLDNILRQIMKRVLIIDSDFFMQEKAVLASHYKALEPNKKKNLN